jgi:hypothetical protein
MILLGGEEEEFLYILKHDVGWRLVVSLLSQLSLCTRESVYFVHWLVHFMVPRALLDIVIKINLKILASP